MRTYVELFPGNPFADLQTKLLKYSTDKEERAFFLDILRSLDILTDYIKPGKVLYDVSDFPFIKLLEENFPAIKEEFVKLEQHHLVSWPEKYLCKKGWDVFGLFAFKNRLADNCALCPQTTKILEQIPGMHYFRYFPACI
jgi:aspartyl/asparaginyl beta-hydroxylase (cupin superfamily)